MVLVKTFNVEINSSSYPKVYADFKNVQFIMIMFDRNVCNNKNLKYVLNREMYNI